MEAANLCPSFGPLQGFWLPLVQKVKDKGHVIMASGKAQEDWDHRGAAPGQGAGQPADLHEDLPQDWGASQGPELQAHGNRQPQGCGRRLPHKRHSATHSNLSLLRLTWLSHRGGWEEGGSGRPEKATPCHRYS